MVAVARTRPDHGAALLHTQALEGVTSDRLDAASPEQVFLRYAEARGSERITELSPQEQDMPVPHRIPELVPRVGTHKILIGQDLLAATPDSQFGHAAIPRKKGIIHGTVAQIAIQRQGLIDLVQPPFRVTVFPLPIYCKPRFGIAENLITAEAYFSRMVSSCWMKFLSAVAPRENQRPASLGTLSRVDASVWRFCSTRKTLLRRKA